MRFKYTQHLSGRSLEEDLKLGMARCDAIVGSYFKEFGEAEYPVDEERVEAVMLSARA